METARRGVDRPRKHQDAKAASRVCISGLSGTQAGETDSARDVQRHH